MDLSRGNLSSFGPRSLKRNEKIKKIAKYKLTKDPAQNKLIDHFIKCIQSKKQESPNFADGKKAVEFVLEAYSFKK